ncbi:hypothetical protein CVCC1112_4389 [Paenarthrobacter nicotinovorans]|nr:hypothetical protein CVCC1112_4389 [Paenarthrobacter nicotinovorans]
MAVVLLAALLPGWSTQAATDSGPTVAAGEPSKAISAIQPFTSSSVSAAPSTAPAAAPAPQPAPSEAAAAATGSPPLHITYAKVGMDQAIVPLAPTEAERELGSIVPPYTHDAYWLAPYGMPGAGSTNTTYLVGHSWEGQASPFNNISTLAQAGDRITVTTAEGLLEFRVDSVATEYKDTLRDSEIWDRVPERLILITCYAADLWGNNIVVLASPERVP